MDKTELLSRCYALRAGLSAIAVEKDKVDVLKNQVEKQKYDLKIYSELRDDERNRLLEESRVIEYEKIAKAPVLVTVLKVIGWIVLAIGLVGVAVGLAYLGYIVGDWFIKIWFQGYEYEEPVGFGLSWLYFLYDLCSPVIALLCFAGAIGCLVGAWFAIIRPGDCVYWDKVTREKAKSALDRQQMQKTKIQNYDYTVEIRKASENKEIEEKQKNINEKLINSKHIVYALQKEYSSLLDTRDWKNLDFIIYYLETGRADTLKEALLETDKENRHRDIMSAISQATVAISRTISSGFAHLELNMARCFQIVSNQINEISVKLDTNTKELSHLVSITNMNNALQAKANETSIDIMKSVEQMRIYADDEEIRNRNR